MDFKCIPPLAFAGLLFALLHVTTAGPPEDVPEQGFFMAARYPETGRAATLHIYALDTNADAGDFVIKKDGGLLSNGIETGDVSKDDKMFGCFLRVFEFNRMRGLRYGRYEGSLMDLDGNSVFDGYTMVKPRTDILDTRGLQTITVYPESDESSDLPERVNIGVAWRPGCRKIKWDKGKRRRVNSGPRMILTSTEDAGLYTIRRRSRAKRGWFVQILVIAATCPENYYYSDEGACVSSDIECLNGGVLRDRSRECICPPFLVGDTCSCAASGSGEKLYLAVTTKTTLTCGDLPGGHKTCKGMEICYGDTFGCKCSPGYWGNACDQECPKGRWGVDCNQLCPDSEPDCNRFWGPKTNLCFTETTDSL